MVLKPLLVLRGHSDRVNSVAKIGSAGVFASVSSDKTIKFWSVTQEACVKTFTNFPGEIEDIVAVDDATVVTVGGCTVRVYRFTDGHIIAEGAPFAHTLCPCALLSATSAVVGDSKGNLFKIEWHQGTIDIVQQVNKAHKGCVTHITVHGDRFATSSWDTTAKLWDAASLKCIYTFRGHRDGLLGVALNGSYLVTAPVDGKVRVHDIRTRKLVKRLTTHTAAVTFVHFAEEKSILVSVGEDELIALHSLPSGECIVKYSIGVRVNWGAFLNPYTIVLACSDPHVVNVFEIEHLKNHSETSNRNMVGEHEIALRHQFKSFAVGRGKITLAVDEATTALNMMLVILNLQAQKTVAEFRTELEKLTNESEVTEDLFVKVYRLILMSMHASDDDYWTHV